MADSELPHHDLVDVYQKLDEVHQELSLLMLRITEIDQNLERLVQLVARPKD